jgi:cobalt-zinc-cadmium efflux system protein
LLSITIALVLGFAGVEWLAGCLSHSLALRADAGHLLADSTALGIALMALWLSRHPRLQQWRIEGLAGLINGLSLVVMAGLIGWEAVQHLQETPTEILSLPMMATAVIGLIVNGFNIALLHDHTADDLTLRGAVLHLMADILSSLGVLAAALAVWGLGWFWADSAVGVLVAGLIGSSAVPLLWESCRHLGQGTVRTDTVEELSSASIDPLECWDISQFSKQIQP